ncbi:MAG: S8 family serine peptidase, partial [Streptococcaceae bacterium]|nr:S8 family serine peptidase [Streptococcaceae bacterium]
MGKLKGTTGILLGVLALNTLSPLLLLQSVSAEESQQTSLQKQVAKAEKELAKLSGKNEINSDEVSSSLDKASKELQEEQDKELTERIKTQLLEKGYTSEQIEQADLDNEPVKVFVQLKEDAAVKDTSNVKQDKKGAQKINRAVHDVINKQSNIKKAVKNITKKNVGRSYGYLYNGFSTEATKSEITKIKALSNVQSVSVARTYTITDSNSNQLGNVDGAWNNATYPVKGEKTVISIIDSGIDVNHKDLRLSKETEPALSKDVVQAAIEGDAQTQGLSYGKYYTSKVPYAYNYADHNDVVYDNGTNGMHGMHVAGIAGANGENADNVNSVVGVAPEAQFLDMKVFSNTSIYAYAEDVIAAIEDSVRLGANVINLSLGASNGSETNDPEQIAIKEAAKKGVVAVIAAGNSGAFGGVENQDKA